MVSIKWTPGSSGHTLRRCDGGAGHARTSNSWGTSVDDMAVTHASRRCSAGSVEVSSTAR